MLFPTTNISTINPNIVNYRHSPASMHMTNVIIKFTKHQQENQNLSKILQIISHSSTLQSARKIPTHNGNTWTTIQPVHSILTTTNLQPDSWLYTSYFLNGSQLEDSQTNCIRTANPHAHQLPLIAQNQNRDQDHTFRWLQNIAVFWLSSTEASYQTVGSVFSTLRSC